MSAYGLAFMLVSWIAAVAVAGPPPGAVPARNSPRAAPVDGDAAPFGNPTVQVETMFGFSVREERRWVVASDAFKFRPGEMVLWTMRLENIDRDPSGAVAHFRLTREARTFSRRNNLLNPDEMDVSLQETELWVNENGFPLRVWHRDDRSGSLAGGGYIDVRWLEGRLQVSDPESMSYRQYDLRIPGGGEIDDERPAGVFLSAELNPGLIALPFALAREAPDFEIRFMAFDPTPLLRPGRVTVDTPDAAMGPGGSGFGSSRRSPNPLQLSERSFRRTTLTIGKLRRIPIGGVTQYAHHVDLSSGGDVFVEPGGKVVRVNIMMRRMNAWIRLLRPSEY